MRINARLFADETDLTVYFIADEETFVIKDQRGECEIYIDWNENQLIDDLTASEECEEYGRYQWDSRKSKASIEYIEGDASECEFIYDKILLNQSPKISNILDSESIDLDEFLQFHLEDISVEYDPFEASDELKDKFKNWLLHNAGGQYKEMNQDDICSFYKTSGGWFAGELFTEENGIKVDHGSFGDVISLLEAKGFDVSAIKAKFEDSF
jgi:hypothetical protein